MPGQNLSEILQAVFEPFSENKFSIIVGMYNKGNRRFSWKLREIWKLGVGARFRSKFKDTDVAVTFRDLILLPGWTEVEPNQVQLSTQVTVNHSLNMPCVASPMDTVTESEMG